MYTLTIFINSLLACVMLPSTDEFIQCIDNVVLEYNMSIE